MTLPLLIALLVFAGVMILVVGLWWAMNPARAVRERLAASGPGAQGGLETELLRAQVAARTALGARLQALMERAGFTRSQKEVVAVMGGLGLVGALVGVFRMGALIWGWLGALALASLPLLYLAYRATKRMTAFQKDFPDALDMMTRSIRAGHALGGAIRLVGEEMPAPIGPEFLRVSEEMRLGLDPTEALAGLERRVPADDVKFFCTAVAIHRSTGGNLAEVLDRLTEVIRERYRLLSHARVLSTQHRWSAILVGLSPIAFALIFQLLNPSYFDAFWQSSLAPTMVAMGLMSEAIGFMFVWRISKIKV
jgi:tight adherence protein B